MREESELHLEPLTPTIRTVTGRVYEAAAYGAIDINVDSGIAGCEADGGVAFRELEGRLNVPGNALQREQQSRAAQGPLAAGIRPLAVPLHGRS